MSADDFAKRLWGDIYFSDRTRRFTKQPTESGGKRTFVTFVLEPLYKLYAHVLGSEGEALRQTLEGLGIYLKPAQLKLNTRPLLRLVLQQFFGDASGFVSMLETHVPSPAANAQNKVGRAAALCSFARVHADP